MRFNRNKDNRVCAESEVKWTVLTSKRT